MVDGNDGVPLMPYILDHGALHAYMRIMCILNNSEPTELIFLQSCQLIPNPPRYSRASYSRKSGGPCEVAGPRPRARPSYLLVDSGNICPP
jgi:hypothetical protein